VLVRWVVRETGDEENPKVISKGLYKYADHAGVTSPSLDKQSPLSYRIHCCGCESSENEGWWQMDATVLDSITDVSVFSDHTVG
jgi:hypothetical protein